MKRKTDSMPLFQVAEPLQEQQIQRRDDGVRVPPGQLAEALADPCRFPQLLNIQEASLLTQVPVKTLYAWSSQGKLVGIATRIGKHLRFDRDALLRMWTNASRKTPK